LANGKAPVGAERPGAALFAAGALEAGVAGTAAGGVARAAAAAEEVLVAEAAVQMVEAGGGRAPRGAKRKARALDTGLGHLSAEL